MELLPKYHVSTLSTFTILLLVKIKDLDFSCWNSSLRLTVPQSLLISTELHISSTTCFTGHFFQHFLLGQTFFFLPPPPFPSPASCRSCSKGSLQSRHWDCFVSTSMPALLMPLPWLWKRSLGSQPAGAASAAFSFLEPGIHHTKKTLSSIGCNTLWENQITWQCPFQVHNGSHWKMN